MHVAATQPVEAPNLYVRIVPTAKSLFNISKLKMTRNNIHSVHQGGCSLEFTFL